MTLTSNKPVAAPATQPPAGFIESNVAITYAVNAALAHPDKTGDLVYLPKTKEEAMNFPVHPWVLAAIVAAMRGVRDGTTPVLGDGTALYIPNPPISDHLALVSEGIDLGLVSASRMNATGGARVGEPYATAAQKVLTEAVRDGYLHLPVRLEDITTAGETPCSTTPGSSSSTSS